MTRPRLLIEDWLPAAAIGVECIRERSTGRISDCTSGGQGGRSALRVRRCLPSACCFPRDAFERLLGFGRAGQEIVAIRRMMDTGYKVPGGFGYERAFKNPWREDDHDAALDAARGLWGEDIVVIDPMAGGGSIPLEAARLSFRALANEYNPVACSVLEATVDYPFRYGERLARKTREWGRTWGERVETRLAKFFPKHRSGLVHAYILARTVPCPDTQHPTLHPTPLVPDWHLLKSESEVPAVADPVVDKAKGTWRVRIKEVGSGVGQLAKPPAPTYADGKGVSLFSSPPRPIPADYIKAKAQAGEMKSALYVIAVKTPQGLRFELPEPADLKAIDDAEKELARLRAGWEKSNIIPTELYPEVTTDERPRLYGMPRWADMFSPRQLLCFGVLVEELKKLRSEMNRKEGGDTGEAIAHLLALVIDKFAN